MFEKLRWAERPISRCILGIAGSISIVAGAIAGTTDVIDWVLQDKQLQLKEANKQIGRYEENLADSRVLVGVVVATAFKESQKNGVPSDCKKDKEEWSAACREARERWQKAFVKILGAEGATHVLAVTQQFRQAMVCADTGRCDVNAIRAYFEPEIYEFWQTTFPYLIYMADQGIPDALWIVGHCSDEKCKPLSREVYTIT